MTVSYNRAVRHIIQIRASRALLSRELSSVHVDLRSTGSIVGGLNVASEGILNRCITCWNSIMAAIILYFKALRSLKADFIGTQLDNPRCDCC